MHDGNSSPKTERAVFPPDARAATGRYLAFLDSDDLWKPKKLEKQLAFFKEHPEIEICHTRETWLRSGKVISQSRQSHARSGHIFPDALKKCIIGPSTVMLKRELFFEIGQFREDLEIAEDYEIWLWVTAKHQIGYIDEPLVIKRGGHPDQLSEKHGQIEIFCIKALRLNLDAGAFSAEQRSQAAAELARKWGRHEEEECYILLHLKFLFFYQDFICALLIRLKFYVKMLKTPQFLLRTLYAERT